MYKSCTREDRERDLKLPSGYSVDAMICYGSYDIEKYTNLLVEILDQEHISYTIETLSDDFLKPITSLRIGDKRIWYTVNYGGSMLCEFLHWACMFGSQKNILVGSCGGLSPQVIGCDIIIPTYTHGDESSTRMYNRSDSKRQYSDITLSASLAQKLGDAYTVYREPLITCGAMLAETREDVQQRSSEGYFGVEMESATIFAVSNHFNVPSAALIYVSDNLIQGEIVGDATHSLGKEKRKSIQKELLTAVIHEVI